MGNNQKTDKELFIFNLQQLAFDFESSPTVMQGLAHDRKRDCNELVDDFYNHLYDNISNQVPQSSATPVGGAPQKSSHQHKGHNLDALHIHQGRYLELALALLDTCAVDLILAKSIQNDPSVSDRKKKNAQELEMKTIQWLTEEIDDSAISFQNCALLLEQELRLQSLDEIELPAIYANRDILAEWIVQNPKEAHRCLKFYLTIFAPDSAELNDCEEDISASNEDEIEGSFLNQLGKESDRHPSSASGRLRG